MNEKKVSVLQMNEMKKLFFSFTPLEPRDALYGGRTSPACLFKEVNNKENIYYVDLTSLYLFVQKSKTFPTGHPQIYVCEKCKNIDLNEMFGVVKCKILHQPSLDFPVLPLCAHGKLLFPLCSKCTLEVCLTCDHDDDERALSRTWTTVEVNKAIEKGYRIIEVYEVYHYKRQERIFAEYVNKFLKIKQEASGYPTDC